MSDNAKAMTLEEKLVQTIKERELFALIGDEDAITKLVERAVQEALFQPRKITADSWGRTTEADSPLVEAARAMAATLAKQVADREIEKMLADETTGPLIRKYIVEALPMALSEAAVRQMQTMMQQGFQTHAQLHQLALRLGQQLQS